jgi:hypothetical protein
MLIVIEYMNLSSCHCDSGMNLKHNNLLNYCVSKMASLGYNWGRGQDLPQCMDVSYYNFLVIYLDFRF